MLRLHSVALGCAASLGENIGEDADIGQRDKRNHPKGLTEARHILPTEKVTRRRDE